MLALAFLFAVGVAATTLWLAVVALHVETRIGWTALLDLYPSDLIALAAAAFGPVAVLWLVIGFMRHAGALRDHTRTMRQLAWQLKHSTDHTEAVARGLVELQAQGREQMMLRNLDIALRDMNAVIAALAVRAGLVAPDATGSLWTRFGNGDPGAFARLFTDLAERDPDYANTLGAKAAADPSMRLYMERFMERFERIWSVLRDQESDGLLRTLLEDGDMGRFAEIVHRVLEQAGEQAGDQAGDREPSRRAGPEEAGVQPKGADMSWTRAAMVDAPSRPAEQASAAASEAGTPLPPRDTPMRPFSPLNPDFPRGGG